VGKKLYVGNVPFSATEGTLMEWFSPFGNVETATVITDRASGRSKGFGFVEFASDDEAERAISEMNGKEVEGRALTVNEARPMEPRRREFGGGDRRGGSGGGGGGRRPGGFGGGRGGRGGNY